MKLMQNSKFMRFCMCIDESEMVVLRIQGKVFYSDIGDIINKYTWGTCNQEELLNHGLIEFKNICEFTTNEDLKEQMIEYLI